MSQEESLLSAFAPELDGKRQRMYRLLVASDERSTKVYPLQIVSLGLKERDLANVVTV